MRLCATDLAGPRHQAVVGKQAPGGFRSKSLLQTESAREKSTLGEQSGAGHWCHSIHTSYEHTRTSNAGLWDAVETAPDTRALSSRKC